MLFLFEIQYTIFEQLTFNRHPYFFLGACSNKECPFRHIDPESKIKDCAWYDRGFCRHGTFVAGSSDDYCNIIGPHCKSRHRRRVMCPNYLAGFCPDGALCKFSHPTFDIPVPDPVQQQRRFYNQSIVCHNCHERGHKATYCPHLPATGQQQQPMMSGAPNERQPLQLQQQQQQQNPQQYQQQQNQSSSFRPMSNMMSASGGGAGSTGEKKALSEVTCYKVSAKCANVYPVIRFQCGEKGHYANRCTKGALAFLSSSAHLTQEIRERDEQNRGRGPSSQMPQPMHMFQQHQLPPPLSQQQQQQLPPGGGGPNRSRPGEMVR
jgi:hypothetical protein